jgi:dinuclear metal center YbgI/SA1388 family protein
VPAARPPAAKVSAFALEERLSASLHDIVDYLDSLLARPGLQDASLNGLQVEASSEVARVGLAVDAALPTIASGAEHGCDLLVVHHGLFWGADQPLRGALGARVARCFEAGVSVYASHLPLDVHPEVGNNALLSRALGADPNAGFGDHGGVLLGTLADLEEPLPLAELAGRLAATGCDDQTMWAFGPDPVQRLAVLTGSGASFLRAAVDAEADCFITGETRHSAYHEAREAGINCIFAGHYATETFGVRALGERLRADLGVETEWLHLPTGI